MERNPIFPEKGAFTAVFEICALITFRKREIQKTNKMKKIVSVLFLLVGSLSLHAQDPDFDDLKILYADANFEKLVKVAEGYTNKDELKKNPLPFVWLAKGLYKNSLSGTDNEKFKNAYKDAVGALGKAIKNDKDGTGLSEHEEFIEDFQMSMVEMINNDISAKDYSKASSWLMKYYKITRNPIGAKYLDGATKYRKADKSGANTLWKEADLALTKLLTDPESVENWSEADQKLLTLGALQTAECFIAGKQVEKSNALLKKILPLFEEDEDFKTKCAELMN